MREGTPRTVWLSLVLLLGLAVPAFAAAQANYEIQVYGADTVPPQNLMVEVHSNFTVEGQTPDPRWRLSHEYQEHETLELTEGLADWSEVGFYVFTSEQDGHGDAVGRAIPPPHQGTGFVGLAGGRQRLHRNRVPARRIFTGHVDLGDPSHHRQGHRPLVLRDQSGPGAHAAWAGRRPGFGFSPAVKISYDFTRTVSGGIEWYADYGAIRAPAAVHDQQQQVFAVVDLNVSPVWEFNFGVGIGATGSTDHLILKAIVGRRIDWGRHSAVD